MALNIKIYSKVSCIPSNDFIEFCKLFKSISLETFKIRDSQFPQIAYDVEFSEIEAQYNRKFFSLPIIFINDIHQKSIQEATINIKEMLK